MSKRRNNLVDYEHRYRYKLNMLEPGLVMMRVIAGLCLTGTVLGVFHAHIFSLLAFILAGIIFSVMLV